MVTGVIGWAMATTPDLKSLTGSAGLAGVTGRPGWTVLDRKATVDLGRHGWRAVIRASVAPSTTFDRFHVAIIDPDGMARHTHRAGSVVEAIRIAEAAA
jgi:hypothetical protein